MNKLNKLTKAIGRIIRHPYLLNLVLQDEDSNKEDVIRKYGLKDGLPVIEINELFLDFEEVAKPYVYLSGATMPIDIALLRALAKRYAVKNYFEIGTWRGESVANLAEVAEHCVTFNLPKEDKRQRESAKDPADACGDRHAGHAPEFRADRNRQIHEGDRVRNKRRQIARVQRGFSHIDFDRADFSIAQVETQQMRSACGFNRHILAADVSFVEKIFSDAADAVAGHLSF